MRTMSYKIKNTNKKEIIKKNQIDSEVEKYSNQNKNFSKRAKQYF